MRHHQSESEERREPWGSPDRVHRYSPNAAAIFFRLEMSERSLNAFNTHNHAGKWAFQGRVRLKPNEAAMRPIRSAQHESSMTAPAGAGVVGA